MFLLLFALNVSAHPGRTDSNGGHYNRSTGEYHFHHGYDDHQHPDGVCPYDFDDNTDSSASSNETDDKNNVKTTFIDKVFSNEIILTILSLGLVYGLPWIIILLKELIVRLLKFVAK